MPNNPSRDIHDTTIVDKVSVFNVINTGGGSEQVNRMRIFVTKEFCFDMSNSLTEKN